MLVINHLAKILRFGGSVSAATLAGAPVGVKGVTTGLLKLMPGANEVNPEVWAAVCARFPTIEGHHVPQGDIEVVEDAKGQPLTADDIGKLKEPAAIKLVKATANEAMLMKWLDTEKRKGVLEAIENQLEALAKAGEPATKKGEEA